MCPPSKECAGMETAVWLDFYGVEGARKRRTFSSRKPNSGESHTSFLNEQVHESPSASLPSDPRNVVNNDKGLNDVTGKYLNSHSRIDDYKRRLGNSNSMGRFEMGNEDLGRSLKSGYSMASGDDDLVPERVEMKRVRREFAGLNGNHVGRSPDGDRNYDIRGSKFQDYEHSKSSKKSYSEKSHRDSKESKEYSTGEKLESERSRFSKTFKRKCNCVNLDQSKRFHEGGMEMKGSHQRHGSYERLEHDCHRDQDQDRDRSLGVQSSVESSKGGQGLGHSHKPEVVVGLGSGRTSVVWSSSDGHKVLERRSLDSHNLSHVTGGMHSEHSRLPVGSWRAERRTMDSLYVGHSKIASKGPNGGQVKTAADGRTSDSGDPDMKALAKSVLQQVDLPSQEGSGPQR